MIHSLVIAEVLSMLASYYYASMDNPSETMDNNSETLSSMLACMHIASSHWKNLSS